MAFSYKMFNMVLVAYNEKYIHWSSGIWKGIKSWEIYNNHNCIYTSNNHRELETEEVNYLFRAGESVHQKGKTCLQTVGFDLQAKREI